jgi:methyl-coenzyme M reductase subunit D
MQGAPTPERIVLPEIMIMPSRLLSADTTEKILNKIYEVKYVRHINCQGESLPLKLTSGAGSGLLVNHPERKVIKVNGKDEEMRILVGRIFVEIEDFEHVEETLQKIEKICEELLPFGFDLEVGRYSKFKPTTTDYANKRCS